MTTTFRFRSTRNNSLRKEIETLILEKAKNAHIFLDFKLYQLNVEELTAANAQLDQLISADNAQNKDLLALRSIVKGKKPVSSSARTIRNRQKRIKRQAKKAAETKKLEEAAAEAARLELEGSYLQNFLPVNPILIDPRRIPQISEPNYFLDKKPALSINETVIRNAVPLANAHNALMEADFDNMSLEEAEAYFESMENCFKVLPVQTKLPKIDETTKWDFELECFVPKESPFE